MREWAERRGEVRAATVATLHFIRDRAAEWRHVLGMLSLLASEDDAVGPALERWQYVGTFFHPHLRAWLHDLRYRGRDGGPQVSLRVPASDGHRPTLGREDLARVEARVRGRLGARGPRSLELVISAAPGRAFALVIPVVKGPTVWRCVRESLFPAPEERWCCTEGRHRNSTRP